MTTSEFVRIGAKKIVQPNSIDLLTHATVIIVIVICATILGDHHVLTSGDTLAVFTTAITGTAAVAGARSGNRRVRTTDDNGGPID